MKKKIKYMIYIVCMLWIVAFVQIILTKAYVNKNDVTQAFARNQLMIEENNTKISDLCREGGCIMGKISGKLTLEEKKKIADSIFGYEGGSRIFEQEESGYYVTYGYTNGINMIRKVNGRMINMNIAITYDENEDKSLVYFGVPFVTEDF